MELVPQQGGVAPTLSPRGDDVTPDPNDAVAAGAPVELIEAKAATTEEALGQLVAGRHMFPETYPGHGELTLTACVWQEATEPAKWLYAQYPDIRVELVDLAPPGSA